MSTVLSPAAPPQLLTYEAYMAEETDYRRYDIVDGVKEYMGATRSHQKIQLNLAILFRTYEKMFGTGETVTAPCDVSITRRPLRTRQPDVFFMSNRRIVLNPPPESPKPISPAPELVVEIISDSETASRFNDKVRDYCTVDVQECWKVMPETQSVEVLRLSRSGAMPIQTYGVGETVQSLTFSDLTASVDAIFAA